MPDHARARRRPPRRSPAARTAARPAAVGLESLERRTLLSTTVVKDINPQRTIHGTPNDLEDVNGTLYFAAESRLWKSNGATTGTVPVHPDLWVSELTNFQGTLYFAAESRLWKTDGTEAGTVPVSTTAPGPRDITVAGGRMFFRGSDGGGEELWSSDGTPQGTLRVKDVRPGAAGSNLRGLTNVNGRLYFRADDGAHGEELWTSDGTPQGTYLVRDTNPGAAPGGASFITGVGSTAYFAASDGATGFELWRSDGTRDGTTLVTDLRPGPGGAQPMMMQNLGGTLIFLANDGVSGYELWRSTGAAAGTTLVKDIIPGAAGAQVDRLKVVGDRVYFTADDGVTGHELWATDGTAGGTALVKDINPGTGGSGVDLLTSFGGDRVMFVASAATTGLEPWVSDGTADGTFLLEDITPGHGHSGSRLFTPSGGRMFFAINEALYASDGTRDGTALVHRPLSFQRVSSQVHGMAQANGVAYFSAWDGFNGHEPWRSDGTPQGTWMLKDIGPGGVPSWPHQFTGVGDRMYFIADGRLWTSNGTTEGTVRVSDIPFNNPTLFRAGNTLYFTASAAAGSGLWKSDGTSGGTVFVKSIPLGNRGAESFTDVNGTLYFVNHDAATGHEIWRSDGTPGGTAIVKDIIPGPASSGPYLLTNVNGTLFFRASDGAHGYELWKSDGTPGGTEMVKDIVPGAAGSVVQNLIDVNGTLFFTADDRTNGQELWRSNGTAQGTVIVRDIYPGERGSSPGQFTVDADGTFFFRADDGVAGSELWTSNGAADGTRLVKDLNPGPGGSQLGRITSAGTGGGVLLNANSMLWHSNGTTDGTVNVYPFLMEEQHVTVGGAVLMNAWSAGGYELVKFEPDAPAGAAAAARGDSVAIPPPPAAADSDAEPEAEPSILAAGPASAPAPLASAAPGAAVLYNGVFGEQPDVYAAGLRPIRVIYGEYLASWMDGSMAEESAVRRIANEVADADRPLMINLEHWRVDIRNTTEGVVAHSLEKMEQLLDWVHDERPEARVGYAGMITLGAYPTPAAGTPGHAAWQQANNRLAGVASRVDMYFPGVYAQDDVPLNWLGYARGHIPEAARFGKPVYPVLDVLHEGGHTTGGRPLAPELFRTMLEVSREMSGLAQLWGPWGEDATWWLIARDFIAAPDPFRPSNPTAVTAVADQAAGRITLAWKDNAFNESGYRIDRRAAGDAAFATVANLPKDTAAWSDANAVPGTQYVYRVVASNAGGESAALNEPTAKIVAAPGVPSDVAATPLSNGAIRVTWTLASPDVETFLIERAVAGQPFVQIATTGGAARAYDDTGTTPGAAYKYRLRSTNTLGMSGYSAEASATATAGSASALRARWRLDAATGATVADSAAAHHGTLVDGPAWTAGHLGNALAFDGIDDRVVVPDAAGLRFAQPDSFTFAAWVNLASLPNRAATVLSKARGSAAWLTLGVDAANRWTFAGPGGAITAGAAANLGWTHVAAVQDGAAGTRRLFINGAEVAAGAAQSAGGVGDLWIGAAEGAAAFFAGKIDDVRVYARPIAAAELTQHANPRVALAGGSGADAWTVRLHPASDAYEFFNTANPAAAQPPAFTRARDAVASIDVAGGAGDDRLVLDFTAGQPLPDYGFTFNGGGGSDTLAVRGGGAAATYNFDVAATGLRPAGAVTAGVTFADLDTLDLLGGAFDFRADLAGAVGVRVGSGATAAVHTDTLRLAALDVAGGAVHVPEHGNRVLRTRGLSFSGGGTLDLFDNELIVDYPTGGASPIKALTAWLVAGRDGDQGIRSTTAINSYAPRTLGIGEAFETVDTSIGDAGTWHGQSVDGSTILIKYTYTADGNLDGFVDGGDYAWIDSHVGSSDVNFTHGDYNLDGAIDGGDYAYIDVLVGTPDGPL